MACSCSKKSQPTGFAKPTDRTGAQAAQRTGASSVPGAVSAPINARPTGSR